MSGEERICACRKRIKVQDITTNLFGTLYPDGNGFVTCSYNYRESGKYEISIDMILSSQNDGMQQIVRIAQIFSWFKLVAQNCGLNIVSFLVRDLLV